MKDLDDLIRELDAAEKEYKEKCRKYGIIDDSEKKTKKKEETVKE